MVDVLIKGVRINRGTGVAVGPPGQTRILPVPRQWVIPFNNGVGPYALPEAPIPGSDAVWNGPLFQKPDGTFYAINGKNITFTGAVDLTTYGEFTITYWTLPYGPAGAFPTPHNHVIAFNAGLGPYQLPEIPIPGSAVVHNGPLFLQPDGSFYSIDINGKITFTNNTDIASYGQFSIQYWTSP